MLRIALLLVLVFGSSYSHAEEFAKTFNHVTLVVSDVAASKRFYIEKLGLTQIDTPWLPERQMFVSIGENLELHVGEVDGVEINPNGFNHFAISVDKFDDYLEHLKSQGIVYKALGGGDDYFVSTRPDKVRQTWITDPDGYWIEINDAQ